MYQSSLFFFFTATPPTEIYTLSLHDALPICDRAADGRELRLSRRPLRRHQWVIAQVSRGRGHIDRSRARSEEHTSELQSRRDLVCRLLLEKKKSNIMLSIHCRITDCTTCTDL